MAVKQVHVCVYVCMLCGKYKGSGLCIVSRNKSSWNKLVVCVVLNGKKIDFNLNLSPTKPDQPVKSLVFYTISVICLVVFKDWTELHGMFFALHVIYVFVLSVEFQKLNSYLPSLSYCIDLV